ncbi:MAG: 3-dehydroquinate synthase [Firmicutes bacterium]|nr:3-dehydroquinate synthase [Bacillota bacterium]MCM1400686.1 3-dehydroquinate synthase [Bacteroides sp.]MCM1476380.1 3-dehydroquinate synthase [Bacteroides sp.]
MAQQIIFTAAPAPVIDELTEAFSPRQVFLLTDVNTLNHCVPLLTASQTVGMASTITIPAGDSNKNITSLQEVWTQLGNQGANRGSLLINLGGGMVTDLGGFAAATFKRGIRFINIPTTLLGAVDAAVGGKTGINFNGLKNEVGAFREAEAVIVSPQFYSTLPHMELLSGYGEVLKHALLDSSGSLHKALGVDLHRCDASRLGPLIETSVKVKCNIVEQDPLEKGIRRALNLGHTAAHAFESLAMLSGCELPHGVAVAHGLIVDLVLSHMLLGFPSAELQAVGAFVKEYYPVPKITCNDYPRLIEFMRHDKKNASVTEINFTLLDAPGKIHIDCKPGIKEIETALDIARDLLGA